MRAAVARGWVRFSETFESNLDFLYLDVLGWVTIGLGLLADPVEMLARMGVEFYWPGPGRVSACTADVRAAHAAVKAATALERGGGVAFGALPGNAIRATPESLAKAADYTLAKNEANVRKYFPGWDTFPAAGQMLILSMAWAMGSHAFGRWPHFVARVNEGDWLAVAVPHDDPNSCLMSEHGENEGFHLRNLASLELAKAAAFAVDQIYEFAEGQAHAMNAIERTGQQLGITTDRVQEFQFAARSLGLEEELDVDALLAAAKVARAAEGTAPARA